MPASLSNVIVGVWEVDSNGTVEFKADGTFIDDDDSLVDNANDKPMKYFVDSESAIRIRVTLITDIDYLVSIKEKECDRILMNVTGLDATLRRQ